VSQLFFTDIIRFSLIFELRMGLCQHSKYLVVDDEPGIRSGVNSIPGKGSIFIVSHPK